MFYIASGVKGSDHKNKFWTLVLNLSHSGLILIGNMFEKVV